MALSKVFCELPSLALPDCMGHVNADPTAVCGAGSVLQVLVVTLGAERKGSFLAISPGRQTVFSTSLIHGLRRLLRSQHSAGCSLTGAG